MNNKQDAKAVIDEIEERVRLLRSIFSAGHERDNEEDLKFAQHLIILGRTTIHLKELCDK